METQLPDSWEVDLQYLGTEDVANAILSPEEVNMLTALLHQDNVTDIDNLERTTSFPVDQEKYKDAQLSISKPKKDPALRKMKRREIVQRSEQKRRSRMKEKFDEIKNILPQFRGEVDDKKKASKEEVLTGTIDYMKKLELEVRELRETVERQTKKAKLNKSDPFVHTLSQEELTNTFQGLFSHLHQFKDHSESMFSMVRTLEDLASKIEEEEYNLYALLIKHRCIALCDPDPIQQLSLEMKGIDLYKSIKAKNPNSKPLMFKKCDLTIAFTLDRANTLLSAGYVDDAFDRLEEVNQMLKQPDIGDTEVMVKMDMTIIHYILGEPFSIIESQVIGKSFENDPMISTCAKARFAMAIATNSKSEVDRITGIQMVEAALDSGSKLFGPTFGIMLSAVLLNLYLITGQIEKGLQRVDGVLVSIEKTGIQGVFGVSEILRLKGELLMVKMEKDGTDHKQEIQQLFSEALKKTAEKCLKAMHLKSILSAIRFWKKINSPEDIEQGKDLLKTILDFYSKTATKHKVSDIEEGKKVLAELTA